MISKVLCSALLVRVLGAWFSHINDCDETYNYWEAVHFLTHGYGLQTWEYSPRFALRSWLYVAVYALVNALLLPLGLPKHYQFYCIRTIQGVVCALCEYKMYNALKKRWGWAVAYFFVITSLSSPGMFGSAVSNLPTSLTMISALFAYSWMVDVNASSFSNCVISLMMGSLVGWPFGSIVAIPMILDKKIWTFKTEIISKIAKVFIPCVLCLVLLDSLLYNRIVITPVNLVWYNAWSTSTAGPNMFGKDPWWFYLANGTLNFGAMFWFGLFCPLAFVLTKSAMPLNLLGFHCFLLLFSIQAHKEERFLSVCYPLVAVNASLALTKILMLLSASWKSRLLKKWLAFAATICIVVPNFLRIIMLFQAYSAPMYVYSSIPAVNGNVCLGKEWYRYPSSYFLPSTMRLKFLRGSPNALLPGEFNEQRKWIGLSAAPSNLDDRGSRNNDTYVTLDSCRFVVDLESADDDHSDEWYNAALWSRHSCSKFLDSSNTSRLGRIVWLPFVKRKWLNYCSFSRIENGTECPDQGGAYILHSTAKLRESTAIVG